MSFSFIKNRLESIRMIDEFQSLLNQDQIDELHQKIRSKSVWLANQMNIGNFGLKYSFDYLVDTKNSPDKRSTKLRTLQEIHREISALQTVTQT